MPYITLHQIQLEVGEKLHHGKQEPDEKLLQF